MSYTQVHGVRPREYLDRTVLLLAFAAGCGGSAYVKLAHLPLMWSAIVPMTVLAVYAFVCMALRSITMEPDIIGDNCYYLGFLFTLTSLAVTLFEIRDLGAGQGAMAEASRVIPTVISGFGVALASTIAGVFLRIFLMQMRPDIVARDHEARRNLAQGARDFHTAILQASRRLKDVSVEMAQHATERNARIDEITDRHAQQVGDLLAKQAQSFETAIQTAATRLAEEVVTRIAGETDKATAQMRTAVDGLAQAMTQVSRAQVESLPRLEQAQKSVESALTRWSDAIAKQSDLSTEAAQALSGEARQLVATAEAQRLAFADSVQLMASQGSAMIEANEAQRRALAQTTATLTQQSSEMAAALGGQQSAVADVVSSLSRQTAGVEAAVSEAISTIQRAAQRIEDAAKAPVYRHAPPPLETPRLEMRDAVSRRPRRTLLGLVGLGRNRREGTS